MIVRVLVESVKYAQSARYSFYFCLLDNMITLLTKTAHLDMLCLIVPKVSLTKKGECIERCDVVATGDSSLVGVAGDGYRGMRRRTGRASTLLYVDGCIW
jgi:hypothetical protein